jgi:hypothetical protein
MNIKEEMEVIAKLESKLNSTEWNDPTHNEVEKEFWQAVNDLDAKADGLVGKHIKFQVADGYAEYIIVKELKSQVKVYHLNVYDGYTFSGVWDGKIPKGLAHQCIARQDFMKKLFC